MIPGETSFVKACMDYFGIEPHGRRITIPEFQELTYQDKVELFDMLAAEGYTMFPLKAPEASS